MLAVFALLLVGYAILYQCFSERLIYFDEVGLFNPVYTYLHYGKMTYPAHGQFDTSLCTHQRSTSLLLC